MPASSPCPIEQLVNHSEEHFIDRRSSEVNETFPQLAVRRASNIELLMRYLNTLASKATDPNDRAQVHIANAALENARDRLLSLVGRLGVSTHGM